jgi:hypothetical protein
MALSDLSGVTLQNVLELGKCKVTAVRLAETPVRGPFLYVFIETPDGLPYFLYASQYPEDAIAEQLLAEHLGLT